MPVAGNMALLDSIVVQFVASQVRLPGEPDALAAKSIVSLPALILIAIGNFRLDLDRI
jgi:hypothetical protein